MNNPNFIKMLFVQLHPLLEVQITFNKLLNWHFLQVVLGSFFLGPLDNPNIRYIAIYMLSLLIF